MSISTPSGEPRRPSVVSTGKKPPVGRKPGGAKPAAGEKPADDATPTTGGGKTATGTRPAADDRPATTAKPAAGAQRSAVGKTAAGGKTATRPGAGRAPRKPIKPVKVSQERAWGPIALFVAVGVLALAIVGYGAWAVYQGARTWEDRASDIEGIVNYRESDPESIEYTNHQSGPLEYKHSPPVGGAHNNTWQRCQGDVYDAPIAREHAVHSLEHGAVWITYRPDLPAADVEKLAAIVRGNDFMLLSPYEDLDTAVSAQAWGYQLKVDNADDPRIKEFATVLSQNASMEPGVPCSSGNYTTATGTTPRDMQPATGG